MLLVVFAAVGVTDATGQVAGSQLIAENRGGLGDVLSRSDFFGVAVADIGDVDGDGVADVAVGAESADAGGSDVGAVHILFMDPAGSVAGSRAITATDLPVGGLEAGDAFGTSVAAIGDLNGDGVPDLAVGARGDDQESATRLESTGAVWILFLSREGSVQHSLRIADRASGFSGTLDSADLFGRSLAFLGPDAIDGRSGLAVGAPGDDDGGPDRGAIWMLALNSDGTVASTAKVADGAAGGALGLTDYEAFGTSLAAARDESIAAPLLAVGSPFRDDGGPNRGALWLLSLDGRASLAGARRLSAETGFPGELRGDAWFGRSVGAADLDGDGDADLLIGAPNDPGGGEGRGAAWHVLLEGGDPGSVARISDGGGALDGLLADGDRFGYAVAVLSDIDGNGVADYAVGAPFASGSERNTGALWILFGGARPQVVWPGDTDGNGLVEAADVLPIGVYLGLTGPPRPGASLAWTGQPAPEFSPPAAVLADATGDGLVSQNDVLPIGLNYGNTAPGFAPSVASALDRFEWEAADSGTILDLVVHLRHADAEDPVTGIALVARWSTEGIQFEPDGHGDTGAEPATLRFSRIRDEGRQQDVAVFRSRSEDYWLAEPLRLRASLMESLRPVLEIVRASVSRASGSVRPLAPGELDIRFASGPVTVAASQLPESFALHPAYPNPFNPATTLSFDLPVASVVRLDILDATGRVVERLLDRELAGGRHAVRWYPDARPSGLYLFRLAAGAFRASGSVMLVK
jgi:hypothetical protein